MYEITHFLSSTTDMLDECNIEWSSKTDNDLNRQIVVEIIYNARKSRI